MCQSQSRRCMKRGWLEQLLIAVEDRNGRGKESVGGGGGREGVRSLGAQNPSHLSLVFLHMTGARCLHSAPHTCIG